MSTQRKLWAVAMLMIAGACASSRTAPGMEPGDDENGGAELPPAEPSPFAGESAIAVVERSCDEGSAREISLTDEIENGFSAEDILGFVEGRHETTIRWTPPEGITVGPESGEHALFITVARAGERARDFKPTTEGIGHGTRCENWLEVDVTVTVQSEGGALNELIEGTLYTSDARVAYFSASAREDGFGGKLEVGPEDNEGYTLSRFDIDLVFTEHGASGTLYGVWTELQQDLSADVPETIVIDRPETLASFGTATCRTGEAAIGLDDVISLSPEDGGTTARQALERLDQTDSLALTWQDGATTTATLRFTPNEPGACVMVSAVAPDDFARMIIRGEISMESADGRVAGIWPAEVEQRGSAQEVWISRDPQGRVRNPNATTPPELGFPGLQSDPGTMLSVTFNVAVAEDSATGSLALGGYHCGSGSLDGVCEFTTVQLESAIIGE